MHVGAWESLTYNVIPISFLYNILADFILKYLEF